MEAENKDLTSLSVFLDYISSENKLDSSINNKDKEKTEENLKKEEMIKSEAEDHPEKEELIKEKELDGDLEDKVVLEDDIEEDLEKEVDETEDELNISYSFFEEKFLAEQFYNSVPLDYMKLWYGDRNTKSLSFMSEDVYETQISDTKAETLTTEEAEETLVEIQYATILGTAHDISSEKRKKFDLWIKFNSALFRMFESMYSVTGNVNYKPLV